MNDTTIRYGYSVWVHNKRPSEICKIYKKVARGNTYYQYALCGRYILKLNNIS